MIKNFLISLFISGFLFSCSNNDDDSFGTLSDHIVIGDQSAQVIMNSDHNMLYYNYDPNGSDPNVTYTFDLNNDGIDDFQFKLLNSTAMTSPFRTIGIKSLHSDALFVQDVDENSVEVLNYNDQISMNSDVIENTGIVQETFLFYTSYSNPMFGGTGNTSQWGMWEEQSNKYVGLIIKNIATADYGWAKISTSATGMTIHEIAYKTGNY